MDDLSNLALDGKLRAKLDEITKRLDTTSSSLEGAHTDIRDLRVQILSLTTTCHVLGEVLTEKLGVDHGELLAAIKSRLPNGLTSGTDARFCASCGNQLTPWRDACVYCGQRVTAGET